MELLTNQQIMSHIADIKRTIEQDEHGGVRNYVLRNLIEAKIIDTMPETALDPYRPLPVDWTAFQVAIFDNGEPAPSRKRKVIQRTKMRWGGNIKVWTRNQIAFNSVKQVAWAKNFYLWDAPTALQVAADLLAQRYIDQATVDLVTSVIDKTDGKALYAIPLLKEFGSGTRWMRSHIVVVFIENDKPNAGAVIYPDGQVGVTSFADAMANGADFSGGCVAQARLARREEFEAWSTELSE